MVIVSSNVVAPPLWKRLRWTTRTKDRKRQDEQTSQTSAIKRASNEIGVVPEYPRSVVAQVELREEADNGPTEQHTCLRLVIWNMPRVHEELWEVDLAEGKLADLGYELGWG